MASIVTDAGLVPFAALGHHCDRGNTLLYAEQGSVVFIVELDEFHFLAFQLTPPNYPSANTFAWEGSREEIAQKVNRYYPKSLGWEARKWNLPGQHE